MMFRVRFLVVLCAVMLACAPLTMVSECAADDAPRMTKEELKAKLGAPDLVIIDVRQGPGWDRSGEKIPGAVREDHENLSLWVGKYRTDQTIVIYCD